MNKKILVTGSFGQIGSELVPALQKKHGKENVIAVGHRTIPENFDGILETAEMSDSERIRHLVEKHKIGTIYHLVSLLSAKGEEEPSYTWDLNMGGLRTILDIAVAKKIRVFWPSSIAAFGPTTPRDQTPQHTVLEPTTMYGVTKVAGELLCQYYFLKYGLDVRSVRYPGIISYKTEPGGGTTDYAVAMYYEAVKEQPYTCFVSEDTVLPMMYIDDAINATLKLMDADPKRLTVRTSYNLTAMSFSAKEEAEEINKHMKLSVTYKPDHRQKIADSWPRSIDDSTARSDWDWKPEVDLATMTTIMLQALEKKLGK